MLSLRQGCRFCLQCHKTGRELCVGVNWPLMGLMVGNEQTNTVLGERC